MKLMSRPFKGSFAYEWQVLCFVLQFRHDGKLYWRNNGKLSVFKNGLSYKKAGLWIDSYWIGQLRRSMSSMDWATLIMSAVVITIMLLVL